MQKRQWRLRAVALALASAAVATPLTACSTSEAGAASCEGVRIDAGIVSSLSDAILYIADAKGYFADEGLTVDLRSFKSAGEMIPYMAAGHLDVGAGAPSAGFYNGIARDIDIKIVADKGKLVTGFNYMPLLVRKDLVESGRVRTPADLAGLTVAEPAPGTATASTLGSVLAANGLAYNDVGHTFLGFADHVAAFQNGSIDAAMTTEPAATSALRAGSAVRLADSTEVYNEQQLAVLLYSGDFVEQQRAAAQCFMNAYVRAARDYSRAVEGGRWEGPGAGEIIDIVAEGTGLNPAVVVQTVPGYVHPDAVPSKQSLRRDYEFFVDQGLYRGDTAVDFDSLVDTGFVDHAAQAVPKG